MEGEQVNQFTLCTNCRNLTAGGCHVCNGLGSHISNSSPPKDQSASERRNELAEAYADSVVSRGHEMHRSSQLSFRAGYDAAVKEYSEHLAEALAGRDQWRKVQLKNTALTAEVAELKAEVERQRAINDNEYSLRDAWRSQCEKLAEALSLKDSSYEEEVLAEFEKLKEGK